MATTHAQPGERITIIGTRVADGDGNPIGVGTSATITLSSSSGREVFARTDAGARVGLSDLEFVRQQAGIAAALNELGVELINSDGDIVDRFTTEETHHGKN